MKIIKKLDDMLVKVEEYILSYAIIIMALILIADVFSRNVLGQSLYFANEFSQLLIILVTFMGISYAARKGRHIRMSALFDSLPYKPKKALAIFIPALTAIILFVLSYFSLEYTLQVYESGRLTPALQYPAFLMYIFIPIGFFFGGLQYIRNMWINIKEEDIYIGTEKKGFDSEGAQKDES